MQSNDLTAVPSPPRSGAPYPAPVECRRRGEALPRYRIEYDPIDKLILFTIRGFWSYDEASSYIDDGDAFVSDCRRRFGRVRLLADRRAAQVQPAQIADRLMAGTSAVRPEDRIAFVVDSSLVKLQLHRAIGHTSAKSFISIDAARIWLTAHP